MQLFKKFSILMAMLFVTCGIAIAEEGERCDVVPVVEEPCDVVVNDYCPERSRWWINFGLGAGISGSNDSYTNKAGGAGQISFNGAFSEHIFVTLYSNSLVKSIKNHNNYFSSNISDHHLVLRDKGIMLGYIDRNPCSFWSLSAGLGAFRKTFEFSKNGDDYWYDKKEGVALPIQGQWFWTPFRHFGIGLIGHAVLADTSYASALLAIQIT